MSVRDKIDPIREHVEVSLTPTEAFRRFTERLAEWWPPAYTWSGESLEAIVMEPRLGGRCFERGPEGFRCDWGRVTAWDPPNRVAFSWQISPSRVPVPDPDEVSQVEVNFAPGDTGGTRLTLEHRWFENHGEGAEEYRAAMAADEGWPWILEQYAQHVEEVAGAPTGV